ncbi:MAG: hypothetical protein ACHQRM_14110 [Bacteroidia bacterium]
MKRLSPLLLCSILLFSCAENKPKEEADKKDSLAVRKRTMTEELPPPSEIHQFKFFYSGFVKIIALHADTLLNKLIHPIYGVNIIESSGALPHMTNVKDFTAFKTLQHKAFYDFDTQVLICDILEEDLPKVDCNAKEHWSKTGCFTREANPLKDSKIFEYCNLSKDQLDKVVESSRTITRTVVLTDNYTYYFSLIKGSWWLTFVDMRTPCSA